VRIERDWDGTAAKSTTCRLRQRITSLSMTPMRQVAWRVGGSGNDGALWYQIAQKVTVVGGHSPD
jgi:hypothetical protein